MAKRLEMAVADGRPFYGLTVGDTARSERDRIAKPGRKSAGRISSCTPPIRWTRTSPCSHSTCNMGSSSAKIRKSRVLSGQLPGSILYAAEKRWRAGAGRTRRFRAQPVSGRRMGKACDGTKHSGFGHLYRCVLFTLINSERMDFFAMDRIFCAERSTGNFQKCQPISFRRVKFYRRVRQTGRMGWRFLP